MSIVTDLLAVFEVEKNIRSLRSRVDAAERFLDQQNALLSRIQSDYDRIEGELKRRRADAGLADSEIKGFEEREARLRQQMNSAQNDKQYSALRTELAAIKQHRLEVEQTALESMTKADELEVRLKELQSQRDERAKVVQQATRDRDERLADVKDRLDALVAQRDDLSAKVPADARKRLKDLLHLRGDEAMATLEVIDRRNHEYACSACQIALPVEQVSVVVSGKDLVACPSCHSLLYASEEMVKGVLGRGKKQPAVKG